MHRFWFAVSCGSFLAAVTARNAEEAARVALLQWCAERDGELSPALGSPVTIVVPAGGRVPEDYLHARTNTLLRELKLPTVDEDAWSRHKRRDAC